MRSSIITGMFDASESSKPCSTMSTIVGEVGRGSSSHIERLQRVGVACAPGHHAAFAVVLADDDQRAAHHAGAREVGQRVGGDVGADDRFPGHRAAHRVVDRGAEHRRGRGLVGAGLDVHAELVAGSRLRLHHHVEQVRHRRALVAADVGHARLQQRLGDREDAFAVEGLAVAEAQGLDFLSELAFHSLSHQVRVLDDFGAIEGRAEHRGVRVLAAQAAADAAVDHRRHRIGAQRIGVVLDGERRAAGEADARVVAGAGVLVDAVLHAHVRARPASASPRPRAAACAAARAGTRPRR